MDSPEGRTEPRQSIAVLDYGVNNVGSVMNALRRVGAAPYVARSPSELEKATAMVLPGIGAFDTGVTNLRDLGLFDAIKERVAAAVPILGICLGMQLLTRGSEEGKLEGLGLIDATTKRFAFDPSIASELKVPHMGWHDTACSDAGLFDGLLGAGTRFYYVHSYHVVCDDPSDAAATCNYGLEFTSALHRRSVYGTQFHPEKSHRFGLRVFANYVRLTRRD
jgi:glutamine amidotransferase